MQSGFFKLNLRDLGKGFIVAVFAAGLAILLPVLESGAVPDIATLKLAALTGLAAGLAYLAKNLLTNSSGETFKSESK